MSNPENITRFVMALLLPFVTCGVQWLFWPTIKPFVWFLFYPAVFFSSRIGGRNPGLISTAISALLVVYFFIPPQLSFAGKNPNHLYSVIVFLFMGVLFSITHERLQQAERRGAEALEATRSASRLRQLAAVVEQIAGVHDLTGLMALVRRAARELTGADGATMVLRDGDQCHYADEDAIGPLWKGQRFPLTSCISGWAMLHAQSVTIEDIYADQRIPHAAYRPTFVKSLSMVPINRENPVGAIGCYWQNNHKASDDELDLQQALADAMAVGLANLDLIGQLEKAKQSAEQSAREISRLNANLEQRVEERTAELLAANRELDAFAYAVSHDLRAPLRAMIGFSDALKEDFGDRLEVEARDYLDEIIIGSRQMGQLIDGLLTLSRSTRGELRRDSVDLSAMAQRICCELEKTEQGRGVKWQIEAGLKARGDGRMIEAAMRNLLANAWKYTSGTAEPRIRVYAEHEGKERFFCVSDNGAGFDMAHAEKLFKPFQRLHRQDEFPGIGIGLATAQRIVHRHGGMIEATGSPRMGATFRFSLPYGEGGGDGA